MPVLVLVKFGGDPDELVASLHQHIDPVMVRLAPENGARWHSLARTEGGVLVVDVWDDAEGMQRVVSMPEVQEALGRAELPEPQFEFHDLVDYGAT